MDFHQAIELVESKLDTPPHRSIKPVLMVMVGLPGTGKSTLSRAIAQALPGVVVESDFVRKALFPSPTHTSQESQFVHRVAQAVIGRLLGRGSSAISDATNLVEFHREFLYRLADQNGAKLLIVRVVASEAIIRQRLEQRQAARSPRDLSDATWQVYLRMQKNQERINRIINHIINRPHITVNTQGDLGEAVALVLRAVRRLA